MQICHCAGAKEGRKELSCVWVLGSEDPSNDEVKIIYWYIVCKREIIKLLHATYCDINISDIGLLTNGALVDFMGL